MSIYIKGVDIPKDKECVITIQPDGSARWEVKEDWGLHMVGTDAVNVATPHGKLVDLNEIKKHGLSCAMSYLNYMIPTVIDAEYR